MKVAFFQPILFAADEIPDDLFAQIYKLAETLHSRPDLNDAGNPAISIRGGQQIQVYPNQMDINVSWLVSYLEQQCQKYMDTMSMQSGSEDLKKLKPVVTSIWTIRQVQGAYQELHSHPGGDISGNMYIHAPILDENNQPSDAKIVFSLPQTKDIKKFILNDTWKSAPVPKTIILFPSYLPHTVYPWKGKGHRTVMAFDAKMVER